VNVAMNQGTLIAFFMALVRSSAFLAATPLFNGKWLPMRIRIGLAMAISLGLVSSFDGTITYTGLPSLLLLLVQQALAGVALGLCVAIVFSGVQVAGELLDLQVGFSFGAQLDPLSGTMSSPIARFYQMVGMAVVFAAGGHVMVLRGFLRSVQAVPLGGLDLARLGDHLLSLTSSVLVAAIEISLPLIAALFCAEVALGLLGKAAPQLNVLVLGFALKALIAFVLLAVIIAALPGASSSLIERGLRAGLSAMVP
jgi:flagellar biosynthetic protein FliR